MTSRQVFRLMIAGLGLYFSYLAIVDLIAAVLDTLALMEDLPPREGVGRYYAIRAVIEFVLGALFMGGFFPFENLAFPLPKVDDDEVEQAPAPRP